MASLRHKRVGLVPQCDPAKDLVTVDNPPVRALLIVAKPSYPRSEAGLGSNFVARQQPEAIFMYARTPFGVCFKPGSASQCQGQSERP
ncbi:hypothetical protein GCM10027404_32800 [Arthrobacter tumbae]